jgi:hypothetical protein
MPKAASILDNQIMSGKLKVKRLKQKIKLQKQGIAF